MNKYLMWALAVGAAYVAWKTWEDMQKLPGSSPDAKAGTTIVGGKPYPLANSGTSVATGKVDGGDAGQGFTPPSSGTNQSVSYLDNYLGTLPLTKVPSNWQS